MENKLEVGQEYVVNILGTEYAIKKQTDKENEKLENNNGICETYSKEIVILDFPPSKMTVNNVGSFKDKVLRHEIIHAFLHESGLDSISEWAVNEEMVDWFAIQLPKIVKTCKELDIL